MLNAKQVFKAKEKQVLQVLSKEPNMNMQKAVYVWYSSKTRARILNENLLAISSAQMYDELCYERTHDNRWFLAIDYYKI